ncbi:MAG: C40 family peptidase [Desulfitobacteriaceae bacterium]|nr:C40 family peptidase [Desulfitobacteriaceae bacterium]MDI6915413.1 C40 family peptidase [Desulfitobacteriaceae bacterium]
MFFPKHKWVSTLALSGMLVTSGLVGVAPSKAAVLDVRNPAFPAKIAVSKSYVETMRTQLNWRTAFISPIEADVTLAQAPATVSQATAEVKPAQTKAETVQKDASKTVKSTSTSNTSSSSKTVARPKTTTPAKAPAAAPVSRGSSQVDKIISRAYSLKGVPYVWGGTTPSGFDCSGFVQFVFRSAGISLPRTAEEQYKVGSPVNRGELRPGDLVFFQTYKPGASDVRIYIGGGKTIGSAGDGVAIHSLSESYWSKHYLGARRVIK